MTGFWLLRRGLGFVPALLIALFVGVMSAGAAQANVKIAGFAFSPTPLTVNVGDTVTWTNMDTVPHNATADDGSFKTADLQQGQSASVTVTVPGTHTYICTIHPRMKATLIVQATPGMPNTGGGGMAATGALPWLLPALVLLFAGLWLLLVRRQYRARH